MQSHELQPRYKAKGKKRIGRGGKRGTYSGRGQKGQRSRSGHRIRPAERDLLQRIPKLRGIKNKPKSSKTVVLNMSDVERFAEGGILNKKILLEKGIVGRKEKLIKLLSIGEIKKSVTVEGITASKKAQEKIEKAGGKIVA